MKNKTSITKSIAALLCIITMAISFNIYLSYKNLYVHDNLPRDSIIYVAAAKTLLKNSTMLTNNPSKQTDEITKNKSEVDPYKEDIEKKIFINILILFLSFISLASAHNLIIGIEPGNDYNSRTILNAAINKKTNINSTFSVISKEGAK